MVSVNIAMPSSLVESRAIRPRATLYSESKFILFVFLLECLRVVRYIYFSIAIDSFFLQFEQSNNRIWV